ncbi:alcohol dehydrogenase [Glutamicibacter uratoxydans]|uniref:Alcohol dehydrogenase n=1 Tax=Glutamicibacter uratoxydans TaxID=43667 RepID=A0A4Y4DNY4_GLUUR|nr:alcohol dehydrogenase family protein [Glutamicibacter uratoxydans]GED05058.1 alcohol dehydrogenase [Glutamicibacter uratoxydans]
MTEHKTMAAVVLTGHGGIEKLEYRTNVAVPSPGPGEVLINVKASAVNNTDINTRIGWYSKQISEATERGGATGFEQTDEEDASWSGASLKFPLIQGADVCGEIVAVGEGVAESRLGERVLVRNMLRSYVDYRPWECWTFGSECNGGFAQYAVAPSRETYKVDSDWSDEELAAVPCAYSTAELMLDRAGVEAGERVLVTGASGGVGLAAVQLAKRRGAYVIALSGASKVQTVLQQGADEVLDRSAELSKELNEPVHVVLDVVCGEGVNERLSALRKGGRYAIAGAIGGPITEVDLRTIYLNDLRVLGCTFQDDHIFENLIGYVERNEIRPHVAKVYPLEQISLAQEDFLSKKHMGKLVLVPPAVH